MDAKDRELLELAAKAGKVNIWWHDSGLSMQTVDYWSGNPDDDGSQIDLEWNPLLVDGDAFALAVQLELGVVCKMEADPYEKHRSVVTNPYCINQIRVVEKHYGGNAHAATRRAIVRAAAEIGRAM